MADAKKLLVISAVDFAEARAIFGSGEEKRCAAILKSLPAAGEDAKALARAVTALLLGAEGQAVSERAPFDAGGVRRIDRIAARAFRTVLSSLTRGVPVSLAYENEDFFWKGFLADYLDRAVGADRNPHLRLRRRPLFGRDAADDPERWGALDRDETAALAPALPPTAASTVPEIGSWYPVLRGKVVEAAKGGLGLLALPASSEGP